MATPRDTCEQCGDEPAMFVVTVTAPAEPARVNSPKRLCADCAGVGAVAFAGYGWASKLELISEIAQ